MPSTERRTSISSSLGRDMLAAPMSRAGSKGPESSTVSVASSEKSGEDMAKSTDGTRDRFQSRNNSEDARSDTSSHNRRRMSRLFKGRKKRRGSGSQDDVSHLDPNEAVPPLPDPPYHSDDSLGLAKSVASSLLTEDSDTEA